MNPAEENEIKPSDLSFRWADGYYDGILSGFAIWRGRLCYFQICDDAASDRRFTVHSLSDEEAQKAVQAYDEFRVLHGDHNDLLPDGSYAGGTCITTLEEAAAAGDAIAAAMAARRWQPPVSFHRNPILGWFTSTTF